MKVSPIKTFSYYHGLVRMLEMMLLFLIAGHLIKIGMSGAQIGALFLSRSISNLITMLPSGFFNDRVKSKHLITLALALESSMYVGLGSTENFSILLILFFIGGLGHTMYKISADSVFYRMKSDATMAKEIAFFNNLTYFTIPAGIIIASILLQSSVEFTTIFLATAIAIMLTGLIAQIIVSDKSKTKVHLVHYGKDLMQPKVLYALAIVFLFFSQFAINTNVYEPYLSQILGLNPLQVGLFISAAIVPMAFITHIIAKAKNKISTSKIVIWGLIMAGTGNIIVGLTQNTWIALIGRITNEMGNALMFFFLYYAIGKLFTLERVGGNASVFALVGGLSTALFSPVFSITGEKQGYEFAFILSGVVLLVALAVAYKFSDYFEHE